MAVVRRVCAAAGYLLLYVFATAVVMAVLLRAGVVSYEDLCEFFERAREPLHANPLWCSRCPQFTDETKAAASMRVAEAIAAFRKGGGGESECPVVAEAPLLVYLRLPKVGSSTMVTLINVLAESNAFVNNRVAWRLIRNESVYVQYMSGLLYATSHANHGPYLHFERYPHVGASLLPPLPPLLPATMVHLREPIGRFLSHYDYLRWGPRPVIARIKMMYRREPSFYYTPLEECLAVEASRANLSAVPTTLHPPPPPPPPARRKGGRLSTSSSSRAAAAHDAFRDAVLRTCLRDAFWTTQYLCGWDSFCSKESSGVRAYEQARRTLEEKVLVVGLTERFEDTVAVAERLLPSFFRGATERLAEIPRQRVNLDKRSSLGEENVGALVRSALAHEIVLYRRAKEIFLLQLHACLPQRVPSFAAFLLSSSLSSNATAVVGGAGR